MHVAVAGGTIQGTGIPQRKKMKCCYPIRIVFKGT